MLSPQDYSHNSTFCSSLLCDLALYLIKDFRI